MVEERGEGTEGIFAVYGIAIKMIVNMAVQIIESGDVPLVSG